MAEREAVGGKRLLDRRAAQARPSVAVRERLSTPSTWPMRPRSRVIDGLAAVAQRLDPADHARASAEGHDRDVLVGASLRIARTSPASAG